ncbi:MAG TPA: condensation domain-containing protein, partial [Pyrinomonadaceae bacterium]|nr:condensation domain-containing protein [Pyrinomonadaceae bacterium]
MNDLLKRIADLSPEKRGLLAQRLKGTQKVSSAAKRIPRHNGSGDLPLSYAQQRLWFLDQLRPGDATYNIPAAVRLRGSLNVKAMEDALSEVVRRHEILRTTFPAVAAQPRQVIHSAQPIRLPVKSLMSLPEDLREDEVRRLARLNSSEPFDLAHGPLLRASLTQIGDEDYVLMFTIHHIISDGWSLGVMVREVGVLYEAFYKGETSPLPEMAIQYKDYAVWQQQPFHQELFAQQLEYWKKQLAGLHPTIDLSTRPRPPVQSFRGSVEEFALPEKLSQSILELGQREGATLFMTLLTAFSVLLHRYTGRNDLVVGTDVANRNSSDTEGLIGFFINQLIVRAHTSGDPTFRELLRRLKDVALDGFANQELPFERLVAALQPERSLSYTPLFQVKLVVQNTPVEPIGLHGLTLEPFTVHNGTVGFDLILTVAESTNKLQGSLEYNTDIFDAAAIQRLLGHYETILKSAVSDPELRISQLPMLTFAERRQLLGDFNRSNTDLSAPVPCLHQLFEQQVASFPDHPALVAGSVQLSYSELNSRANQLAHFLRRLGVGAEVRVGLCVERSVEMVVGILGVLKAGGAYVPLDPQYPSERL